MDDLLDISVFTTCPNFTNYYTNDSQNDSYFEDKLNNERKFLEQEHTIKSYKEKLVKMYLLCKVTSEQSIFWETQYKVLLNTHYDELLKKINN